MKKRVMSFLMAAVMACSSVPTVGAVSSFDFLQEVQNELPAASGDFLGETPVLPQVGGTDFMNKLSGDLPAVRKDGFLAEPTAPLKKFPESGLMAPVSAPEEGAIEIDSVDDLAQMIEGGSFVLTADIDLSGVDWEPLGQGWGQSQAITLDGQGHTISGLTGSADQYSSGLFGFLYGQLTVRNLILRDVSFTRGSVGGSTPRAGALAACANGGLTLENCVLDGFELTAAADGVKLDAVGGFVGYVGGSAPGVLRDCAVRGSMDLTVGADAYAQAKYVGGMVGYWQCQSFEAVDCLTDMDMTVGTCDTNYVGGIAGELRIDGTTEFLRCVSSGAVTGDVLDNYSGFVRIRDLYQSPKTVTFTDCLFDGSCIVETDQSGYLYFGGLTSDVSSRSITLDNCRFEGEIDAGMECAGGLIGSLQDRDGKTVIRNCLADGTIRSGEGHSGGLVARMTQNFKMEDCLAAGTLIMDAGEERSASMGGLIGECYGWNNSVTRCVSEGTVAARFAGGLIGYLSSSSAQYQPLLFADCINTGEITGKYDYYSNSQYGAAGGLLGSGIAAFTNCVAGGTVAGDRAGGLLGDTREELSSQSEAKFVDCRADCVLGGEIMGGLLGAVYEHGGESYATFTNCAATADMITDAENNQVFGGLMGQGQGDFERCQTVLNLTHTGSGEWIAGGLVGENIGELVIWDSSTEFGADGQSTAGSILGGILGAGYDYSDYDVLITNCVSEVDLEAAHAVGVGGIAGSARGIVTRCTAVGTITTERRSSVEYGYVGGILGEASNLTMGECCSSVTLNASDEGTQLGGLIGGGNGNLTVYSSWSDADITFAAGEEGEDTSAFLGGLIGGAYNLAMQDCCFLGEIGGYLGSECGGLVGRVAFDNIIRNCYAQADIKGLGWTPYDDPYAHTGGIAGFSGGTIRDCYFKGTVQNDIGVVGGIVGCGNIDARLIIESCEAAGSVIGYEAGGVVGKAVREDCIIRGCTFDGQLGIGSVKLDEYGDHYILGGIAGMLCGTISDCEVKQPLRISKTFAIGSGSPYYKPTVEVGGIVADHRGKIEDCVTAGVSVTITNADDLLVGGITGHGKEIHPVNVTYTSDIYYMDNCTVNGGVMGNLVGNYPEAMTSGMEDVCVGGLLGGAYKTAKLGGCTVNGTVTGALKRSHEGLQFSLKAGGLGGSITDLRLDACEFNGALIYPTGLGNLSNPKNLPLLGYGTIAGASAPEVAPPPEQKEEDYKITVYGYTMQDLNGYLLPKANITVDGKGLGRTNEFGEFGFSNEDLDKTGNVVIEVSHEEYFETSRYTYLADKGEHMFWLKKKEPGQIYFKTVQYQEEYPANLLNRLDSVTLLQQDTKSKKVKVEVDWNNIDEEGREVYLLNGKGNVRYNLDDNSVNNIRFTRSFKPGDEIYIVAEGTYNGEPVEAKEKLALSIRELPIKLPVEKGKQQVGASSEADEDSHLYFLQGLNLDLGFGSMVPFASDISVMNDQLKVEFTWKSDRSEKLDVWEIDGVSQGVDVFIDGTLKIPISDAMDGEWSGELTFGINQMPDVNFDERVTIKGSLEDLDYPGVIQIEYPLPLPVPSYFETQIGVGGSGTLRFYGPYDKVNVAGKTTVTGYGLIGIGLGGSVGDNVEFKVGGEGELRPEISMVHDPEAGKPLTFEPEIQGAVSAKASFKAFIIGHEVKIKLGGFRWNKEKLEWFALGEEGVETMALTAADMGSDWQAVGRGYLENGGGFRAADASFRSFSTVGGAKKRYENIAPTADTVLTVNSKGNAVIYYTADDESAGTSGTVANHTALWMSERDAETDAWSNPVQLSAADSYPALPHADGDYVIWVESAETDTLDEMLTSTVIKLAKNGEIVATYNPGCYVYDPQVAASYDGSKAVISWMQDRTVTGENLLGGSPVLYYAQFDGSAIGTPQSKKDASKATLVYSNTLYQAVYRYCEEEQILRRNYDLILSAPLHRYATDGTTTANFDENGNLTIYQKETVVKTLETSFSQNSTPVLAADPDSGEKYLFWAENGGIRYMKRDTENIWSEPFLLTATNAPAVQLAAAIDPNGMPHVSWLEHSVDAEGAERTDLYTMALDTAGIDLVLEQISYDKDHLLDTGEVKLEGIVYNNSLCAADGLQVTITDENGSTVYLHTVDRSTASGDRSRFYAVFAPDGASAHTYTVTVAPVVDETVLIDTDSTDNALEVGVTAGQGEIVQIGFIQDSKSNDIALETIVRNTGGAAAGQMTVIVTDAGGATVKEETFADVPIGSSRQVLLPHIAANERYTVSVKTGTDETDCETALYTDPNAPFLKISSMEWDRNGAEIELRGQGQTEGAYRAWIALYQNGRMKCAAADTAQSLNGSSALTFEFDKALQKGEYDYKLFFLANDGTSAPLAAPRSGSWTVE